MFEIFQDLPGFSVIVGSLILIGGFGFLIHRGILKPTFRRLSAYETLDEQVGLAVETGGQIHITVGASGIVGEDTGTTVAALTILGEATKSSVISDRPPLITLANATTFPAAADVVQRSYRLQNVPDKFEADTVQVVALDPLTLAGSVTSLAGHDKIKGNILVGALGQEVVLMTEAGNRQQIKQTVGSDLLEGQAVAFAAADHQLIGEEMFAVHGYVGDDPTGKSALVTQDILRIGVIGFIIVGGLLSAFGLIN